MSKKTINILILIVLLLITIGLFTVIVIDEKKIKEYKSTIEVKDELIEQQGRTIVKLRSENDALWDNYYMNVSEYDGEYYE